MLRGFIGSALALLAGMAPVNAQHIEILGLWKIPQQSYNNAVLTASDQLVASAVYPSNLDASGRPTGVTAEIRVFDLRGGASAEFIPGHSKYDCPIDRAVACLVPITWYVDQAGSRYIMDISGQNPTIVCGGSDGAFQWQRKLPVLSSRAGRSFCVDPKGVIHLMSHEGDVEGERFRMHKADPAYYNTFMQDGTVQPTGIPVWRDGRELVLGSIGIVSDTSMLVAVSVNTGGREYEPELRIYDKGVQSASISSEVLKKEVASKLPQGQSVVLAVPIACQGTHAALYVRARDESGSPSFYHALVEVRP